MASSSTSVVIPKAGINAAAILGLFVAGYALYIEHASEVAKETGMEVTFFCDKLVSWASCSHAITGPYGRVLRLWGLVPQGSFLDVPNAAVGFCFYVLALLPWNSMFGSTGVDLFILASTFSLAFSLYLAYVLKFILHEFCIICVSSYVLNTAIFIMAVRLWSAMKANKTKVGGKKN